MIESFRLSTFFFIILFTVECSLPFQMERALDTWVIRTNLDGRPGMIGLGLHQELYAAYDAQQGALYKVWKGDIKFTGPVYDNLHGPQPFSRGEPYIEENLSTSPWSVLVDDERKQVDLDYQGYSIIDGRIELKYSIQLESGEKIRIQECPDYILEGEQLGFRRVFTTSDVPPNVEILLSNSFVHLLSKDDLTTDGEWIELSLSEHNYDWGSSTKGEGILKLKPNGKTFIQSLFETRSTDHINIVIEGDDPDEIVSDADENLEVIADDNLDLLAKRGKEIIGLSDCAACHMVDKPIIGPSYAMIAQKYETSVAMVQELSEKIINGGTGIYGERIMTPHPNVSPNDAKAMAAYILSVVPDDENAREPGVAVDFYDVGQPLASLPEVVAGQNPNVSVVYPTIDFRSGNPDIGRATDENFSGFDVDFVMEVNGYLNVPESKTYELQFIANNGGRLDIDGETVSEGHYYEGTYIDEIEIDLEKGPHRIHIEFYHHLFDKYLILGWRDDGDEEFEPIPASAFTHDPFDIKPTSPGLKSLVSNKAPGFGASLEEVHPAFDLSAVRPEGFEPRVGDIEFMEDGRLVLCTWDGQVYEMKNVTSTNTKDIQVTKIADGLCEPLGITVVDGEIYVLQRWELTKLLDNDGDGIIDEYSCIATFGSKGQFHEWSFGLIYKDGFFYCTTGIAMGRGADNMSVDRGKALKIGMDGSYTYVAYGLKEPNGIGIGLDNEIFVTDNEGEYIPVCKVVHIPESGNPFYGNKSVEADNLPEDIPIKPPVIWLPQNEIGNSPSQPILMHHGPYEGQMIHGEITHGGVKRNFIEKVKGQYQGAVFRFTQGLEVGINRMEWGPDGSLYVAGLGGAQDFGHQGHQFGLQRMTYNGRPPFEMLAIRAKSNGLEIEFTKPLRIGDGTDPADYKVQQWYYIWTHEGESQQKRNLENLNVRSVTLSENRTKAFIEVSGMKKEHVLYVQLQAPFHSEDSDQLWSNEAWYTLNEFPDEAGKVAPYPYPSLTNALSPDETEDGWHLLFDGRTDRDWKAMGTKNWNIDNGHFVGQDSGAWLIYDQSFEDFELEFEWKVATDSEGGLFYKLPPDEDLNNSFSKALRFQLTDDNNEDAKAIHTHKSGSVYDILKPIYVVTKDANEYNHARLVIRGNHVEHWINGIRILQFNLGDTTWQEAVRATPFANIEGFAQVTDGQFGFYSEIGKLWIRHIRLRKLNNRAVEVL